MNSKATPINSELAGQVAVVTGGGRGIGRAIAATLSAAGMTTAILARSASEIEETARTIEQSGGRTLRTQRRSAKQLRKSSAPLAVSAC